MTFVDQVNSDHTKTETHWKEVLDINPGSEAMDPRSITRPHSSLLTYYVLVSAATLFAFPFTFIPLYIRYKTLRYRFDDEGVAMSWELLFRRELIRVRPPAGLGQGV